MKRLLLISLVVFTACGDQQQRKADQALRAGNAHYRSGNFEEAEEQYREASYDGRALHNAGKASYKATEYGSATETLIAASHLMSTTEDLAHVQHDLGNAGLKLAQWADSMTVVLGNDISSIRMEGDDIAGKVRLAVLRDSLRMERARLTSLSDSALVQGVDAYKRALRLDPTDEDTRYNLVFGQHLLAVKRKEAQEKADQQEKEDRPQLSQRARELIQKADGLVDEHRFKEALELLQRGLREEPSLSQQQQYMDKLEVVTKAAEAS